MSGNNVEFGCYGEIPGCTFSRPDEEYDRILFYDRIILDDGEQITLQKIILTPWNYALYVRR